MKTLIIIDVQYDFLPDGNLAVVDGDQIIPVINNIIPHFDMVIATQDWHPADHQSFASNHKDKQPFEQIDLHGLDQTLWPDHCIQGSDGARLSEDINLNSIEAIFRKGMDIEIDSYSGFYDNGHRRSTGLAGYLKEKGATKLYCCGLAADYCVYYSMKDALAEGFEVHLIAEGTRPISEENYRLQQEALLSDPRYHVIEDYETILNWSS